MVHLAYIIFTIINEETDVWAPLVCETYRVRRVFTFSVHCDIHDDRPRADPVSLYKTGPSCCRDDDAGVANLRGGETTKYGVVFCFWQAQYLISNIATTFPLQNMELSLGYEHIRW